MELPKFNILYMENKKIKKKTKTSIPGIKSLLKTFYHSCS